ncbi:MAG: M23 family metallopeptidase [Candidatus Accumulibacter sp.]|jgi:murein DD-endopeptidase MepM/ murein hydrolase activator NlpD|uniref:M23 family metallopeptidase n=1 Tax=Candidatus Accumulibacter affinis TaxID=2954384 RepID=A0A935TAT0_9PROT|nr:M23 family metallopeptidase [Candidatus Accumulibacter affinis]
MRSLPILWLLLACTLSAIAGAREAYPLSITAERRGSGHQVLARNAGPAPVSVRLTLASVENVDSVQALPVVAVVPPYSELLLLQIRPLTPGRSHRFATQSTYKIGNISALPDPRAIYRLPYENGRSFVVSQAAGGPITTHHADDSRYAIDFRMPENTPIVAARGGVVIATESSHRRGGQDPALLSMANYVSILHVDDTVATYAHLAPGGVRVRVGERVLAGTPIGYSGATGYTSGPHLHFVVQRLVRADEGFASVSLPLRFYVGLPPYAFEPAYRQWLTADYSAPGKPPQLVDARAARQGR